MSGVKGAAKTFLNFISNICGIFATFAACIFMILLFVKVTIERLFSAYSENRSFYEGVVTFWTDLSNNVLDFSFKLHSIIFSALSPLCPWNWSLLQPLVKKLINLGNATHNSTLYVFVSVRDGLFHFLSPLLRYDWFYFRKLDESTGSRIDGSSTHPVKEVSKIISGVSESTSSNLSTKQSSEGIESEPDCNRLCIQSTTEKTFELKNLTKSSSDTNGSNMEEIKDEVFHECRNSASEQNCKEKLFEEQIQEAFVEEPILKLPENEFTESFNYSKDFVPCNFDKSDFKLKTSIEKEDIRTVGMSSTECKGTSSEEPTAGSSGDLQNNFSFKRSGNVEFEDKFANSRKIFPENEISQFSPGCTESNGNLSGEDSLQSESKRGVSEGKCEQMPDIEPDCKGKCEQMPDIEPDSKDKCEQMPDIEPDSKDKFGEEEMARIEGSSSQIHEKSEHSSD